MRLNLSEADAEKGLPSPSTAKRTPGQNRDKEGSCGTPRDCQTAAKNEVPFSPPARTFELAPRGASSPWPYGIKPEPVIVVLCFVLAGSILYLRSSSLPPGAVTGISAVPWERSPASTQYKAGMSCANTETTLQATAFTSRPVLESACPEHAWVQDMQALNPTGHKVILDIGCNLGYQSVEFFDSFVPELSVNKRTLYDSLTDEPDKTRCNVCDQHFYDGKWQQTVQESKAECRAVHPSVPLEAGQSRSLEVHAFEPGDVHFPRLIKSRDILFGGQGTRDGVPCKKAGSVSGQWFLHNLAVSNYNGRAAFTKGCNNGRCSLMDRAAGDYIVQVTTVDEFIAVHQIKKVDIMKIDTEGFDPAVLHGAQGLLKRQAVSAILFEYHNLNAWKKTQLKDIVVWLEGLGYACYFEGRPYLYKLTRQCWEDQYEIKQWSNVVCGLAGGPIEKLLDDRSYLAKLKHADFNSAAAAAAVSDHSHNSGSSFNSAAAAAVSDATGGSSFNSAAAAAVSDASDIDS